MLRRHAKTGVLVVALVVLAVEGFLLHGWYDRHHPGPDAAAAASDLAASDDLAGGAAGPRAVEDTAPETARGTGDSGEGVADPAAGDAFAHTATDANSRGDYTYVGHPRIDGDPDAVVLAQPATEGGSAQGGGDAAYGRNIGVWYEPGARRWAIFNQDRSAVPAGAAFEVRVPPEREGFVHRAAPENTVGNATYLDHPLTDGAPDAVLSVTQNWNPGGGGGGVYNDHPVGAFYDGDVGRWALYNGDGAPMPEGAAFNVAAASAGPGPAR